LLVGAHADQNAAGSLVLGPYEQSTEEDRPEKAHTQSDDDLLATKEDVEQGVQGSFRVHDRLLDAVGFRMD
jgi:hypothetical protein